MGNSTSAASAVGSLSVHPAAELFPLLDGDELEGLVKSIRDHGFDASKPVVRWRGMVLDGRNRIRACEIAGVTPRFLDVAEESDPFLEAWKHNGARRNLEASQKAAIYLKILEASTAWQEERERRRLEANEARAKAAEARREPTGKLAAKPASAASREASQVPPRKLAADIARSAGVSRATVERVQAVQRDAPEHFERVARGEMSAPEAQKLVKLEKKHALAEALRAEPLPAPKGPYRVIVSDPPWQYEKRAEDITHRGRNPYPDMTIEEICALPVAALAEQDAVLWLWTTNAFMRDAYRCLDTWGFREKTILTWVKDRMGTGDWLRGKTEHCILAVRGKPLVTLTNQTTVLTAPLREHSRKPDEFFKLVEELCPGSKLEMFAREARGGWASWGAETEKFA